MLDTPDRSSQPRIRNVYNKPNEKKYYQYKNDNTVIMIFIKKIL